MNPVCKCKMVQKWRRKSFRKKRKKVTFSNLIYKNKTQLYVIVQKHNLKVNQNTNGWVLEKTQPLKNTSNLIYKNKTQLYVKVQRHNHETGKRYRNCTLFSTRWGRLTHILNVTLNVFLSKTHKITYHFWKMLNVTFQPKKVTFSNDHVKCNNLYCYI